MCISLPCRASKTLPADTPGYVEIRPACEARASTGYNRIRLDTFPTPLPVKGRDTPGYMRYVRFPCSWCENQHTIQRDTLRYVCLLPCLPRTRTTQIQHDTFTMGGPGQGQIRQDTFRYVAVWSAPSRCGHAWGRLLCTYSKMSVLFLPGASCIQES